MRVQNLTSSRGNSVPNQFQVNTDKGVYFQSYNSNIVFIPSDRSKKTQLGSDWNYSRTTGKYRNQFLRETRKETERKLKEGIYIFNPNL